MPIKRHDDYNREPLPEDRPEPQRWELHIKFSQRSARDTKLAMYVDRDLAAGANVSGLIKRLLWAFYSGAPMPGFSTMPGSTEAPLEEVADLAASFYDAIDM